MLKLIIIKIKGEIMKKLALKLIPLFLVIIIAMSLLIFYCSALNRDDGLNIYEQNLAEKAEINGSFGCRSAFDKSKVTSWIVNEKGAEAVIDFGKLTEVNALLLNEVGYNVKEYSIFADQNGEWKLIYKQNEIGINRLSTFYDVTTEKIKIVIDDYKNKAKINDIKVYNLEKRQREKELRVTSYITPPSIREGKVDPASFDVVTDVQFIAYGRFDGNGNVADRADEELKMLKDMIGNRNVNILLTIFGPITSNGATMAGILKNNMDNTVANVVERVNALEVGGVDFDWEYPANKKEWDLYSEFIIKLHKELSKYGKQLSIADAPWGLNFSDEAIKSIDQLQIMAYDLFDHNGDQNSYAGAVDSAVRKALSRGFKLEQINLGLSFYGRPTDASGVWINYNDPKNIPQEYIMFQQNSWFNTPTTVRDKTVYAILKGIGGIMIFAQDEDVAMSDPLSLTSAIGKAKNNFSEAVIK